MKKMITAAMVAGAALALTACGGQEAEAPAEPAATEEAAPEEMAPEADPADAAAEGLDPTGNPIGMGAPAEGAAPAAAEAEAPAAE